MDGVTLILGLGVLLLACGSVALLFVRWASPNLQGTAWLSGAFAAGATGAALLTSTHPFLAVICADVALLLSFGLLHVAVLRVVGDSVHLWHGAVLLTVQAIVDLLRLHDVGFQGMRITSLGVLVAVQSATTALVLWRRTSESVRAPARFSTWVLIAFGMFNLLRGVFEPVLVHHRSLNMKVSLLAFGLFLAVALGLAFGFFWMTTSTLTAELEHMASTDPLTRLYNRRVFLKWCERELMRSQRSGSPFSLLMIDLDHFKRINDSFGHQTGDEVLCAAVEKMQDSVRGIDVLCRWGGEEFAVLLPSATTDATRIVAERIRENIQKVTLSAARTPKQVDEAFLLTVSIGAATYRDPGDGITPMLQRADKALYEAKSAGRNRVLVSC